VTSFFRRLRNLFRSGRLAADIEREMAFHLRERTEELVAAGMDRDAAVWEARRRLGNQTALRERTHEADIVSWLASFGADVRYALRTLRGAPAFTLVAVLSLALGIGANSAIFSLVNAVMLRSLPVRDPQELFTLTDTRPSPENRSGGAIFTNPIWEAVRDRSQDVARLFAYAGHEFNLSTGGVVRPIRAYYVSGGLFEVLGARAAAGRLLTSADDRRGCAPVAVVSHGHAVRQLGGVGAAVGQTRSLDGQPVTIVGVTEPSFTGLEVGVAPSIYVPLCVRPLIENDPGALDMRSYWDLRLMGRLLPGRSFAVTQARFAAMATDVYATTVPLQWEKSWQQEYLARSLWTVPAAGGWSDVRNSYREALSVLLVVVGVVLLIACANVAHLLLARATARQRELAVRLALGAGRGRLVRQLLTESLLLAGLGAAFGFLFARWASALLVHFLATRHAAVWLDLTPDARVLGFTITVATVTGMLFGLVPAWRGTRVDPQAAMKARSRGLAAARMPVARILVIGQIALSLVLVVAAALLVGSFTRMIALDPGFRRTGVLLANVDFGRNASDSSRQRQLRDQILERLRALPGVRAAAVSFITPLSGFGWNDYVGTATNTGTSAGNLVWFNFVSAGWFATMGTALRAGRDIAGADSPGAPPAVVVNETLVRRFFPDGDPLGQTIRVRGGDGGYGPPLTIVGVVEDARYGSLDETVPATAYGALSQTGWLGGRVAYALRTDGAPMGLAPSVAVVVGAEARDASIDFVTLAEQVAESVRRPRLLATVSGFFGGLALLLSVIGLYGTMSYGVAQRRNELGIRIALGAPRARVLAMVLGEAGRLIAAGSILGIAGALAATKLVASFLYGVTPTDTATFGLSAALLATVALAAAAFPAWRAASVDPNEMLRSD
jgi:putative ABC transport system permease protein